MFIGCVIKSLREEKGYSQKELAKALNITSGCLSKYETGKNLIPIDIVVRVADVLDVSVDYITGRIHSKVDYNCLKESYTSAMNTADLLSNALSLNKNNRLILCEVLTALKCKNDIERIQIKRK